MLSLVAVALLVSAPSQSEEFYSDGTNFVYREDQSCAWYVDFPDGAMVRLSYRHYSGTTFISVVGGPWDGAEVGTSYMTTIHTNITPTSRQAFLSQGIIQPGSDNRRGVAGQQGNELITLLKSATSVSINTEDQFQATYQLRSMAIAMDKLTSCSMAYFGSAPA